jgi:hypothetical protein
MRNSTKGDCSHPPREEDLSAIDSAAQLRFLITVFVCTLFTLLWPGRFCAQTHEVSPIGRSVSPPLLPVQFRAPLSKSEDALDDLISRPQDLDKIDRAVSKAKSNLALRRRYQGSSWWQTADAERRLDQLLRLEKMTAE